MTISCFAMRLGCFVWAKCNYKINAHTKAAYISFGSNPKIIMRLISFQTADVTLWPYEAEQITSECKLQMRSYSVYV